MIIGLFGISGSGKSYLCQAFKSKYPYFYCTSASNLLRKAKRPTSIKALDNSELDNNQKILSKVIKQLKVNHKDIFIELHAVIEEKEGKIYIVEKSILRSFDLDYIFILNTAASDIIERRKFDHTKQRPLRHLEEVKQLQNLENKILKQTFPNKVKTIRTLADLEFEIHNI